MEESSPHARARPRWPALPPPTKDKVVKNSPPADHRVEAQLWQASTELVDRLRDGQECSAEELLARLPVLASNPDAALDLIYEEYATRVELFQHALTEEFSDRFPAWRTELDKQFAFHACLVEAG